MKRDHHKARTIRPEDIARWHAAILAHLQDVAARGVPADYETLGRELGLRPGGVARIVNKMVKKRLIYRASSTHSRLFSLTLPPPPEPKAHPRFTAIYTSALRYIENGQPVDLDQIAAERGIKRDSVRQVLSRLVLERRLYRIGGAHSCMFSLEPPPAAPPRKPIVRTTEEPSRLVLPPAAGSAPGALCAPAVGLACEARGGGSGANPNVSSIAQIPLERLMAGRA